jgi:protease II
MKVHADTLKDDHSWLRGKSNPGVISYLEAGSASASDSM